MNLSPILAAAFMVWALAFLAALPVLAALMRSSQISKMEESETASGAGPGETGTARPQAKLRVTEPMPTWVSFLRGEGR